MKKILSILIIVFSALFIQAQIIITQDDMAQSGDTIRSSTALDVGMLNYQMTGENITWDFTSLFPLAQRVDTFVSVQQTPWVYQIFFLTSANLAQPQQEFEQLPGFQVTDIFNFYKKSNSDYKQVGYGITLNGLPIPTKFNEADKIYQFPVQYGNADSSMSSYEFSIPGVGYSGGWKKRVNHADGWGTLITPYGSFETLRLKSEITQFDSLYIDSLGIGIPVYRQYQEYKWLGQNFGIPLCKITKEGLITSVTYIDSVRSLFTRIPEVASEKVFNLYPNPASDEINIGMHGIYHGAITVRIIGLYGNEDVIFENSYLLDENGSIRLSARGMGLTKGVYFVEVRSENSSFERKLMIK